MYAQYTGVINSNNPSFSESPYSVGTGVYQFESNLFYRDTSVEPVFSSPDSFGMNLQFRTSYFFEKLELQLNLAFQQDQIAFNNIFTSTYNTIGISRFSLGAKYLIYQKEYKDKSLEIRSWKKRHAFDWYRVIPSVAVFGGYNTNAVSKVHQKEGGSFRAGVLLQNNLRKDFNVITNIFYDFIGSENPEINFIITSTYSLSDRWSTFLEYQNIFREFVNDVNFGTGIAYLYNRNFQINSSLRYLIEGDAKGAYASLGVSYRIDNHEDSFKEYDEFGKEVGAKEKKLKTLNQKNGLSKWLNKINIFKSKRAKKKITLSKRTLKSIEKNTNSNENSLYLERKEQGLPVRTRPIRIRVKPTKHRKVKSTGKKTSKEKKEEERKKKEAKKLDNMSVEDIEKELKKLEREEKRLERQQKKEEERRKRAAAKKKKKKDKDDNNTEN